jgi:hypothetical protein
MPITVNATDKFLAGVNHSFTITSDEGLPSGEVIVGKTMVPCRIFRLRDPNYKISFLVPKGSAGQELVLRLRAGKATVEEKHPITEG